MFIMHVLTRFNNNVYTSGIDRLSPHNTTAYKSYSV